MATADRPAAGDLRTHVLEELLAHGKRFDFFQAMRLLRAMQPDSVAPGEHGPLAREAVRLCANPGLGFPASDVDEIKAVPEQGGFPPYLMTVNFLGLFGTASPLPAFYTEDILLADPDTAVARPFLDMFHHRFVSFVYRAWEKYRYDLQYRRGARDEFSNRMFALIGLGSPHLRSDSRLEWARLLPYLGLLGMKVRSATLLAGVVSHYFGNVPVRVEEYVPHRTTIDPIQRNALGVANCTLGASCLLGEKVYDVNTKFRLRIGAIEFPQYREFLPGGGYHDALRELVAFTLVDRLEYDVELVLDAKHVPRTTLVPESPARLGYSTWLGTPRRGEVTVVQAGVA